MLLRVVLEAAGARVLTAEDGLRALRLFDLDGNVDVLCTDLDMPKMGGSELTAATRARRPDLPVVMCTATSPVDLSARVESAASAVVHKPFVPTELVQAVRGAIDHQPAPGGTSATRIAV
jgi:CheY-like chemotaxis protein